MKIKRSALEKMKIKPGEIIFLLTVLYLSIFLWKTAEVLAQSEWQPDVRLTNDPAISYTSNDWCTAVNGNIVHVFFSDSRDGNPEIYYKRSIDSGTSWGADTRLTNDTGYSSEPCVSVFGQVVHVVWYDNRDGNHEIYYKRSTDSGISWGTDTRLTNNSGSSERPSPSLSNSVLHVVWFDNRDGNNEIYYKRSTDAGISWGTDTRLTDNSAVQWFPSISVSGTYLHVVWMDGRDGNNEIYYKRSTDGGESWSADTRLTNNPSNSRFSCVAVSGSNVHVVWYDFRDGNDEIYYKRSIDGGVSWEADTRLTSNFGFSWIPNVAASGSTVHVVWPDGRNGNDEIYYKRSTDGGVSWEIDTRLTFASNTSEYPCISLSGQAVHVVWTDYRDGNYEIYYKRNLTGNVVGTNHSGMEIPKESDLDQNYPNPFNPVTTVKFSLPKSDFVSLKIYDFLGREIATLVNENLKPGEYLVDWDAINYPSGVYFSKLIAGDYAETKKMILIK